MSNRIDPSIQSLINKSGQKVGSSDKQAATLSKSDGKTGGASDSVVLTEQSRLIASLEERIANLPAVDNARIEAVKRDIENGNYKIDYDNLADIMLKSDLDLGE